MIILFSVRNLQNEITANCFRFLYFSLFHKHQLWYTSRITVWNFIFKTKIILNFNKKRRIKKTNFSHITWNSNYSVSGKFSCCFNGLYEYRPDYPAQSYFIFIQYIFCASRWQIKFLFSLFLTFIVSTVLNNKHTPNQIITTSFPNLTFERINFEFWL